MTIVCVALNHRVTPADVLERVVVPSSSLDDVLRRFHDIPELDEAVALSTCNRLEIYGSTRANIDRPVNAIVHLVAARGGVPVADIRRLATVRTDLDAVGHLFSVVTGIDSMAVGEGQIVAQVRAAAQAAAEAHTAGPVLTDLLSDAMRVSKRVRSETTISTAGISLVRAGLDIARDHFGGLAVGHAVVLGAGSVGSLAARLLAEGGVRRLSVASRSEASATRVAATVAGNPVAWADLSQVLSDADILVTATGAAAPVISAEQAESARYSGGGRTLFVLDLGIPRDVDPAVRHLPGVTLVDIPALGRYLAEREIPDQIGRVREIVAEEAELYDRRRSAMVATPVIGAMHAHMRLVADSELERLRDRLPNLDDRQQAETATTVHRIVNKILYRPTVRAKEFATEPGGSIYLEALERLFDLTMSETQP